MQGSRGGWEWRFHVVVGLLILTTAACSARKPDVGGNLKRRLEAMGLQARGTIEAALNAQKIAPEEETGETPRLLRPGEPIWVQSGKSRLLELEDVLQRVSIGDPDLAGIVVLGPTTIMINAKQLPEARTPRAGGGAAGGAGVSGGGTGTGTLLGRTLTLEPRLAETTLAIWTEGGGYDVHSLTVADFLNRQVLLEVTVAELNRTAMEQYGIDFRAVQNDFIAAGYLGGGQRPGGGQSGGAGAIIPSFPPLPLSFGSDRPTFAFIFPNEAVSTLVQALQTEGLATVLAQPKLVAMSGQNAVFQVGGEIPIRIATGLSSNVEFKPFGTLVNFVPRVSDDGDILLTVTPEVSSPDFSNTVEGIPTFQTRRASTSTRLRNGQTLVIGGLMQVSQQEQVDKVPYLGDIPLLGQFFRKTNYTSKLTELLVIVKPSLVHPLALGDQVEWPTDRGPLTNEEVRTQANPAEVTRPRIPCLP